MKNVPKVTGNMATEDLVGKIQSFHSLLQESLDQLPRPRGLGEFRNEKK